jgi:hypothetical protein
VFLFSEPFSVFAAVAVAAFSALWSDLVAFFDVFAGVEKAIHASLQTHKGAVYFPHSSLPSMKYRGLAILELCPFLL